MLVRAGNYLRKPLQQKITEIYLTINRISMHSTFRTRIVACRMSRGERFRKKEAMVDEICV